MKVKFKKLLISVCTMVLIVCSCAFTLTACSKVEGVELKFNEQP